MSRPQGAEPSPLTLVHLLRSRAIHQAERHAYIFLRDGEAEEATATYGELDRQARAVAARLQMSGLSGERALLLYPPGLDFIAAFYGCLFGGVVAVPAYPPSPARLDRDLPRLLSIVHDAKPTVILTASPVLSFMHDALRHIHELHSLQWLTTDQVDVALADTWQFPAMENDTLALLQYTSGSTATPRGVMVSHGNLMANQRMIHAVFRQTEQSTIVSWLPLYHDMGLIGMVLHALYIGCPCVLMSPVAFLTRPLRWLQAITRYKATASGGPNFAYDLCLRKIPPEERRQLDLSSWSVAANGAEPVNPFTLERFAAAFEEQGFRRDSFYPCYGLAEATLLVSGAKKPNTEILYPVQSADFEQHRIVETSNAGQHAHSLVNCGLVAPETRVVIVDPQSLNPAPLGQVGEIWVAGRGVAQGYWSRAEETEATFGAYLANNREGPFLRTGDLGFLRDDELLVAGRLKDLIIIRGRNHYPQDIEGTAAQSHPLLRPGCCAAFSANVAGEERLIVVAEVAGNEERSIFDSVVRSIRQAVTKHHELEVHNVVLVASGAIPKTSSGKVQRRACRESFLSGDIQIVTENVLDASNAPSPAEGLTRESLLLAELEEHQSLLESYLEERVASLLGLPGTKVDPSEPLISMGLDSLQSIELQSDVEAKLHVTLPIARILAGTSIAQLASEVLDQVATPLSDLQGDLAPSEEVRSAYPLSSIQEQLWFLDKLARGHPAYNVPVAVRLQGELNVEALEQSINDIVRRHAVLRTTYVSIDGRPAQVVAPALAIRIERVDVRHLPEEAREGEAMRLATQDARLPFNLAEGPLLRATLVRLDTNEQLLALTMHHIITDLWSLGVFMRELSELYQAHSEGKVSDLPELPVQYVDFAARERTSFQGGSFESKVAYWKDKLADAPASLDLPTDYPRPAVQSFRGARHTVLIPQPLLSKMKSVSRAHLTTPFMTMLAALKALLAAWTGQTDITVGTVIANRSGIEAKSLIGCFMNFLPLRSQIYPHETGQQLLAHVRRTVLDAYSHQEVPFSKMVEALKPARRAGLNPIYNVALLMQGPDLSQGFRLGDDIDASGMPLDTQASLLDLRFIASESSAGLSLECEYNTGLFEAETIEHLAASYRTVLEELVEHPDTPVHQLPISEVLLARREAAKERKQEQTIAIAATFTGEPVEASLAFWMSELKFPCRIDFAPYNQVLQQLLDPSSLLSENQSGINVLLLRLEDWGGSEQSAPTAVPDTARLTQIAGVVEDFLLSVQTAAQRSPVPCVICVCPGPPPPASADRDLIHHQAEELIKKGLEDIPSAHFVSSAELLATYPVETYYDSRADEMARIPYTDAFFTGLGTMIARKIFALRSEPYKAIVVDCDQTLWSGVCGEDGASGIKIGAPRNALQEMLAAQHDAGMLIALCSKNSESDVLEVFARNPGMPLKRHDIISWRINWGAKSENIRGIASELGLSLDSIIFIDDDPIECAEVRANCPEVLTFQLPEAEDDIPHFLKHIWPLDRVKLTDEDKQRAASYGQNLRREALRKDSISLADFLERLELRIEIRPLRPRELARVAQLTQRTNQFNFTTIRRSESEIQQLCSANNVECLVVNVSDRFGNYGLVGAMIVEERVDSILVDTFLLSCRALGRGVEHRMLAKLAEIAMDRGLHYVDVLFVESPKNTPAASFIENIGARLEKRSAKGDLYKLPATTLAGLVYNSNPPITNRRDAEYSLAQALPFPSSRSYAVCLTRIPTELRGPAEILRAMKAQRSAQSRTGGDSSFVAPRTKVEQRLAELWADVLQTDGLGAHEDFFELGGDSIRGTQVISRVCDEFGIQLPIRKLFEAPTIAELALIIAQTQIEEVDAQTAGRILAEIEDLTAEEVNALLALE